MPINVTQSFSLSEPARQFWKTSGTRTTTGDKRQFIELTVPITEIEHTFPVDNAHTLVLQNLDSTNFVEAGFETAKYPARLRPGTQPASIQVNSAQTSVFLRADTAPCQVLLYVDNE